MSVLWILAAVAWASEESLEPTAPGPADHAVNVRYKALWLPKSFLDGLYFDSDDPGALSYDRPGVTGWSLGLEYAVQPRPANFVFSVEYIRIGMDEGYWDDREAPADHLDGDWIRPKGLGMVALGAHYMHEVPLTPTERDVWASILFGTGLGMAFPTGRMEIWHPGGHPDNQEPDCRATQIAPNRTQCEIDSRWRPPPILPYLDVSITPVRLHVKERFSARLDMGIHQAMLALGGAVGGEF